MHIIIVGCGRVGAELAKILANEGHNLVVIDKSQDAFVRLGSTFNGLTTVSYTHLRAHEHPEHLVCRLLLETKNYHL